MEDIEDKEEKKQRTMLYFNEIGLLMPAWALLTIEKTETYLENQRNPRFVYGIVINRGIEQDQRCPVGEKVINYEKIEVRDKAFERILGVLINDNDYNVITLE